MGYGKMEIDQYANVDAATILRRARELSSFKRAPSKIVPRWSDPSVLEPEWCKPSHRYLQAPPEPTYPAVAQERPPASLREVIMFVSKHTGISVPDILSDRKPIPVKNARQIAFWMAHKFTRLSTPQIGRHMNRDHSTVLHGVRQIARLRAEATEHGINDNTHIGRLALTIEALFDAARGGP